LEAEDELRRLNEQVAAKCRALPAGGLLAEDYVFESAADGIGAAPCEAGACRRRPIPEL